MLLRGIEVVWGRRLDNWRWEAARQGGRGAATTVGRRQGGRTETGMRKKRQRAEVTARKTSRRAIGVVRKKGVGRGDLVLCDHSRVTQVGMLL
jgi:hypothetical protein